MTPAGPLTRLAAFVTVGLHLSAGLWLMFRPEVAFDFLRATREPNPIVTPLIGAGVLIAGLVGFAIISKAPRWSHLVGLGQLAGVIALAVTWFITDERLYGMADVLVAFGALLVWLARRLDARAAVTSAGP